MSPVLYNIVLGIAVFVAVLFSALIYFTGKGDAMSGGGGSIRTTFKGKASFDDQMSKFTLILGGVFIVLMLALDVLGASINNR